MRKFMSDFVRPDNATIIVAGDTTLAEIIPQLDTAFGDWKAPASKSPKIDIAKVKPPAKPAIYLLDRPGSQQSVIIAGIVAPSSMAPNNLEISTMTQAFGGLFSSRLNMNLREDKHWAYGAFTFSPPAIGQRIFVMYAPVQTDKTAPAAAEVLKEAQGIIGDHPFDRRRNREGEKRRHARTARPVREYGGRARPVQSIVTYHRPDDYVQTFKHRVEAQKDADIQAAAKEVVQPNELTWVIVGDRKQIEQPVRALNLGAVQVLDADGNVVH